jgi:hypothetical protein
MVTDIKIDSIVLVNGNVQYVDKNLPFGVGNYYCVTSYDTDNNESGKVNNTRFPIYPLRGPNVEFPKNVYVVPNPFRQHSNLTGTGEQYRMNSLASRSARLKSYIIGDLVQKSMGGGSGSGMGKYERSDYQL